MAWNIFKNKGNFISLEAASIKPGFGTIPFLLWQTA
jgi:hypothetical protein